MELLEKFISEANGVLWSSILIIMLVGFGLYFSIRTKFVQFRMVGEMFRLLGEGADCGQKRCNILSGILHKHGIAGRNG